nr:hypothetical protein BSM_26460 [uncultured archaeon]
MTFATLVWTPECIRILTGSAKFTANLAIALEDRYWLGLFSDHFGQLYLRAAWGRQPFWVSRDGGIAFEPLNPVPGDGMPIPGYRCKVHPSTGVVTAMEGHTVWIHTAANRWWCRELPRDLHVRDISIDPKGGFWCAGSVDSQRIPGEETEAAVRYQSEPGAPLQPRSPHLSSFDAAKVIAKGGLGELRTIDAEAHPVIATSVCSWLLDDSSSFVFIFGPNRTHVRRLKGEMICFVDRPQSGTVRVFTCQGGVWQGSGPRLKRYSIVAPIRKSLGISERYILVRGIDTRREKMVVAVEVSPPGVYDCAQDPDFTAVCVSVNGGVSFEMVYRFTFSDGIEIQDVAWLH